MELIVLPRIIFVLMVLSQESYVLLCICILKTFLLSALLLLILSLSLLFDFGITKLHSVVMPYVDYI